MYQHTGAPRRKVQEAMRCRYCVEAHSFLQMIPEMNGFVCKCCGHREQPNDPNFPCTCRRCVIAFLFSHHHHPRTGDRQHVLVG